MSDSLSGYYGRCFVKWHNNFMAYPQLPPVATLAYLWETLTQDILTLQTAPADVDTDVDSITITPKVADFTAATNTLYLVDSTAGNVAVTIPHTPAGLRAIIVRVDASIHSITVAMDTGNLEAGGGSFGTKTLNLQGAVLEVVADGTNGQVLNPVQYGGDATIRNLTVGVGGVGLLNATDDFLHSGDQLAFYGASVASQPTVTGSQGGNAALASLLTALATLGLIIDTTT